MPQHPPNSSVQTPHTSEIDKKSHRAAIAEGRCICIPKLENNTTYKDLKQLLVNTGLDSFVHLCVGTLKNPDKSKTPWCLVYFPTPQDSQTAIKVLKGRDFRGCELQPYISQARGGPAPPRNGLYVTGLGPMPRKKQSDAELRTIFAGFSM